MPSVLTIDDDDVSRISVSKFIESMGFEVAQATNGAEGLAALEECRFDLIVLDVMMPVVDGPSMLAAMRDRGDRTPVIMLTAESRRPVVASVMKSGILDYIVKPFPFEELRRKVASVLQRSGRADIVQQSTGPRTRAGCRPLVDLLIVDDMENVSRRLRVLVPARITLDSFNQPGPALSSAREKMYRAILIDTEMPDTDSALFAQQMRELQPTAAIAALVRRSPRDLTLELRERGFGTVLHKPFIRGEVDAFIARNLERKECVVHRDASHIKVSLPTGQAGDRDRLNELSSALAAALKDVAGASFAEAVVDLNGVPMTDEIAERLGTAASQASALGLRLVVVGNPEVRDALASSDATRPLPFSDSFDAARPAGQRSLT